MWILLSQPQFAVSGNPLCSADFVNWPALCKFTEISVFSGQMGIHKMKGEDKFSSRSAVYKHA